MLRVEVLIESVSGQTAKAGEGGKGQMENNRGAQAELNRGLEKHDEEGGDCRRLLSEPRAARLFPAGATVDGFLPLGSWAGPLTRPPTNGAGQPAGSVFAYYTRGRLHYRHGAVPT